MRQIPPCPSDFNSLALWRATRERELQKLQRPARQVAQRYGLDAATAKLVAQLAGLGDGGRE